MRGVATLRYSDPAVRYLVIRYDAPGGPAIVGGYRDGEADAAADDCKRRAERVAVLEADARSLWRVTHAVAVQVGADPAVFAQLDAMRARLDDR